MTTIALKDMKVAYDSNTTDSGIIIINTSDKMILDENNLSICFHTGNVESRDDYLDIYREHKDNWGSNFTYRKKLKNENYFNSMFLMVNYFLRIISILEFIPEANGDKRRLSYSNMVIPLNSTHALGSGRQFAYGVMDYGGSAEDGVKIAAIRDIYTGGKINVTDIVEFGKEKFNIDLLDFNKNSKLIL